jgi:hypothetical protein
LLNQPRQKSKLRASKRNENCGDGNIPASLYYYEK